MKIRKYSVIVDWATYHLLDNFKTNLEKCQFQLLKWIPGPDWHSNLKKVRKIFDINKIWLVWWKLHDRQYLKRIGFCFLSLSGCENVKSFDWERISMNCRRVFCIPFWNEQPWAAKNQLSRPSNFIFLWS